MEKNSDIRIEPATPNDKERLLKVLDDEIRACDVYACLLGGEALEQCFAGAHGAEDAAAKRGLRMVWKRAALQDLRQRVVALAHDDATTEAYFFDMILDGRRYHRTDGVGMVVSFASWFERKRLTEASVLERSVLDAMRCEDRTPGASPDADGRALMWWRGLADDKKREAVARWHERDQTGRGAIPRELARGAVWPTSTFDTVSWACGQVLHGEQGQFVARCTEPTSVAHDTHSDGQRSWPVDRGLAVGRVDLSQAPDVHFSNTVEPDADGPLKRTLRTLGGAG